MNFTKDDSLKLKGVAVLLLLFTHCFFPYNYQDCNISLFPFNVTIVSVLAYYSSFCIGIFAFISGYGLTESWKGRKLSVVRWIRIRMIRLLSGFWFVTIFVWIVCQLLDGRTAQVYFQDGTVYGIFRMMLEFLGISYLCGTPSMISTWWYMSAAVIFVTAVPLMNLLADRVGSFRAFLLTAVAQRAFMLIFSPGEWATLLFVLSAGVFFSREELFGYLPVLSRRMRIPALFFFLPALAFSVYLFVRFYYFRYYEYHVGILPLFFIVFCKYYILPLPLTGKFLAYFGKHSMNIFLVHSFVRSRYCHEIIYSTRHFLLVIASLLIISLVISIVIEKLKELTRYNVLIRSLCG